ncbi:MAG: hypothetical protein EO766_11970 [Hydrotalea sp. AMD]|uniref:hypothetical protein n=1 Tax=Hydrotalea sp. AMD TaxID=2501297 RepID=UPI0010258A99|nr:hypothetical protein [Hydrotalea sp. AMD]RWZ87236.1 MAG: hypothetical protein EO766_11970 [Hydrotalea sp. AMD]
MFFDAPAILLSAMFFSGLIPTILSTILIVALILEIAAEEFAWGYGSLIVYAVLMAVFTDINPFVWIWHNPMDAIGFLFGYVLFGAVYSTVKYRSFVKTMAQKVQELKIAFIRERNLDIQPSSEIPQELYPAWKSYLINHLSSSDWSRVKNGLYPSAQRDLIINWITFWPVSAIGLFVADPLRELVNWVYEQMISVYRITYDRIINQYINTKDIDFK